MSKNTNSYHGGIPLTLADTLAPACARPFVRRTGSTSAPNASEDQRRLIGSAADDADDRSFDHSARLGGGLALQSLAGVASWAMLVTWPETRTWFSPAALDNTTVRALALPDIALAVAGLTQGAAVGLWLGSPLVLLYVLAGALVWHAMVRPLEKHDLARRFERLPPPDLPNHAQQRPGLSLQRHDCDRPLTVLQRVHPRASLALGRLRPRRVLPRLHPLDALLQ